MTKAEAVHMASILQQIRLDKWVQFGVVALNANDYGVNRIRFCMVELVAK